MPGWPEKIDIDEFNRNQRLNNFPPNQRWSKVEGLLFQQRSNPSHPALVSIGGRDHTGAEVKFWTDLPNAMYLMNMLVQIQRSSRAQVPSEQPSECEPYDGSP